MATPDTMSRVLIADLALIVIGALIWTVFCVSAKFFSSWRGLTHKFPVTDIHKLGKKYSFQSGYFEQPWSNRSNHLSSMFSVELAEEGLFVRAYFAPTSPIFVPWSNIEDIKILEAFGETAVEVNINRQEGISDPDRDFAFNIPKEALAIIQEHIPQEQIKKMSSF